MLKIFSTQLSGLFKAISQDEYAIEDAARLLAQAVIGDGHIYIHGFKEMKGVVAEALEGTDALPHCKAMPDIEQISSVDRVLLFTRNSDDQEALALAEKLEELNVPFIGVSTVHDEMKTGLHDLAHIHINLNVKRGLVPTETGERVGYPSLLVALFTYHGIQLTLSELLEEIAD
ncbi:MAG: DUF2529 domain-containing protein [Bacillus sp. (in: firmicutes)]